MYSTVQYSFISIILFPQFVKIYNFRFKVIVIIYQNLLTIILYLFYNYSLEYENRCKISVLNCKLYEAWLALQ